MRNVFCLESSYSGSKLNSNLKQFINGDENSDCFGVDNEKFL